MNRVLASILVLLIPSSSQAQAVIPEGVRVRVRLEQALSSATAELDQQIQFSVVDEVKVADQPVISQGANVVGTIVLAQPKRRMGRTGKLDFSVDRVTTVDGNSLPLRYTLNKKEGGGHGVRTGIITAGVALVLWPAAPFMLLLKGKDVTINKGVILDVFTDAKYTLRSQYQSQPNAPVSGKSATVTIMSNASGAEIEMDNAFVGNTPTTLQVPPGLHKIISVKSGAEIWQRSVQVLEGSSITLTAAFEQANGAPSSPATSSSTQNEKPSEALSVGDGNASSYVSCGETLNEVPVSSSVTGLKTLKCGEKVTVLSRRGDWVRIRIEDGQEGNVASRFLSQVILGLFH